MRPTTWRTLVPLVLLAGLAAWLLADRAYGSLASLPVYAPVTAGLIAVFELGLARTINEQVQHRSTGRGMHPLQVARAVALAKASSAAGALLVGLYAGFFAWTFPRRQVAAASHDAIVAGVSAAASLLLLVAALLLERACRTPPPPDSEQE